MDLPVAEDLSRPIFKAADTACQTAKLKRTNDCGMGLPLVSVVGLIHPPLGKSAEGNHIFFLNR
jgi:hypothetical protein